MERARDITKLKSQHHMRPSAIDGCKRIKRTKYIIFEAGWTAQDIILDQSRSVLKVSVSKLRQMETVQKHTISRVHTRRIQTFSFPSTPSTLSNSIPSHQQRLAGFLQKSSSFWAIPTEALPFKSPRISVRSFAKAKLQITALLGSGARWPQESSWLKPLRFWFNI